MPRALHKNLNPTHAPDGRTWYETALAEAEKRGELEWEVRLLRSAVYKIQLPENEGKYPHYLDEPEKGAIRRAVASGLS